MILTAFLLTLLAVRYQILKARRVENQEQNLVQVVTQTRNSLSCLLVGQMFVVGPCDISSICYLMNLESLGKVKCLDFQDHDVPVSPHRTVKNKAGGSSKQLSQGRV